MMDALGWLDAHNNLASIGNSATAATATDLSHSESHSHSHSRR